MKPPIAVKELKVTNIHGYELKDDYLWMRSARDSQGKVRPEVEEYLIAENNYTEAVMKPTEDFQKVLYDEMLGRIKQTDLSVPYRKGNWWYFSRTEEGKQYPLYFRSERQSGENEQLLLDLNALAENFEFFSIGEFAVSDDGNFLAFSSDTSGYRQYTLQIKDLRTNEFTPAKIERVTSAEWADNNQTLFIVTEDDTTKRSDKLRRYDFIKNELTDVFTETDELFDIGVSRSRNRQMLFVTSFAKTMREVRFLPANEIDGEWKIIQPREEDHEYSADFDEGKFYITTNKNAKNFRVVTAPLDAPGEDRWRECIAHNLQVKIEDIDFFARNIVVSERENGLEYLRVIDKKTNESRRIPTDEEVYSISPGSNPEYDLSKIRYSYNSPVTPQSTFEYDFATGASELLKQQEIPSGYEKTLYETKRIWITARDGVKVPAAIVYKKSVKFDGSAPMLLYAYGSYGISIPPTFSTMRLSLLNRGVIFALANIRGGGELGEEWREAGRMNRKMNTFSDFIDVAEYFVENKYTSAGKLAIQGGSAGGLLMGAVANMRPDLFKAVVAQVPFVDIMNTMLDASLPLTTSEYIEWGNPQEKAAFEYMLAYSPYDNVKKQNYPNMLIEVSLNDSQVPYWEGAKLAAKIREMNTGDSLILLKTNMGAGHGGASGRYDALLEQAFNYAYILSQVGASDLK